MLLLRYLVCASSSLTLSISAAASAQMVAARAETASPVPRPARAIPPTDSGPSTQPKALPNANSRPTADPGAAEGQDGTSAIRWPRPIETEASYPEQAQGDQEVILELSIDGSGAVTEARAVTGAPPFSTHAESLAMSWRFEPATREGVPIPAKVRFAVSFTEPVSEDPARAACPLPDETRDPESGVCASPDAAESSEPAEETIEIYVPGERRPLRTRLSGAEVRELPGAFGDPFRAIEALPGVVPIASGVPYFYVRGAPPGNVGYYFDGVPLPLLYHFAGGPAVLHPSLIDSVDLYAGAYPARYGRYAGGLVVGEMSPPRYEWRGEGSVRLVDSGALLEAPFAGGRGSLMAAGRYAYTGLVLSLIVPEVMLHYWDYQTRLRYAVDHDDTLEILVFGSGDLLQVEEDDWVDSPPGPDGEYRGSTRTTRTETIADVTFHRLDLRWDHDLDQGRWRNAVTLGLDETGVANGEVLLINHLVGARTELDKTLSPGVTLRTGMDFLFERLTQDIEDDDDDGVDSEPPSGVDPGAPSPGVPAEPDPTYDEEEDDDPDFGFTRARDDFVVGAHVDFVLDVAPKVEITPGLRADFFVSGRDVAMGIDPRIAARFGVTEELTLVHGLGIAHQMPSFVVPIPGAKPSLRGGLQRSIQHSAGVEYTLPAEIRSSFILFHNVFFDMTDLLGLAQLSTTGDEDEVLNVRMMGQAYGAEVMLRRALTERLGGFVAYTLSRSRRAYGRLEGPATTDRTHVLNVALSYNLGRNWRFGNRLVFYSGIPAQVAYLRAARHPPRTSPFWRVDWRLQKRWPSAGGGYWGFIAEVLNTTLNTEALERSCSAFDCVEERIGPVTIPSIGVEAAF